MYDYYAITLFFYFLRDLIAPDIRGLHVEL